jgi:uncharacterized protein
MGGQVSLPLLTALREKKFKVIISGALLEELTVVSQRPRLRKHIDPFDVSELLELLEWYGEWVKPTTIPPRCRDPKDHPVLATAIDGAADAIVSGDNDLRADNELREAMRAYGVELWGIQSLLDNLHRA